MIDNFVEINENLPDNIIISRINSGDLELLKVIFERYNSVINYHISKYCPIVLRDDAFSEATFALFSAVKNYTEDKSSFKTFASLCIKRAVISVVKNNSREKDIPSELLESIEDYEIIDGNSPEKIFFEQEALKNLTDTIRLELSELEYKVLQVFLSGESYSLIAKRLNITEKAVDNALLRIRKKLKNK